VWCRTSAPSQKYRQSKDCLYTFTQEWPAPTLPHQLSFTLPYQRMEASLGGKRAVGDIMLNYRYQVLGDVPLLFPHLANGR